MAALRRRDFFSFSLIVLCLDLEGEFLASPPSSDLRLSWPFGTNSSLPLSDRVHSSLVPSSGKKIAVGTASSYASVMAMLFSAHSKLSSQ